MNDLAVAMVLDRSLSMAGLERAVIDGFNEYLNGLEDQEGETFFSLTLFNTIFEQPYIGVPLDKVDPLTDDLYRVDGNTALYDAIAFTIRDLDQRLKKEGRSDTKVLVVTLTDGQENSSTDYNATSLAALVREYEARGNWTFVYLGLGQTRAYGDTLRGIGYVGDNAAYPMASVAGVSASFSSLAKGSSHLRSSEHLSSVNLLADAGAQIADGEGESAQPTPIPVPPSTVNSASDAGLKESSLSDWLGGGSR